MQDLGTEDYVAFDPEPERTLRKKLKATRQKAAMGDLNPPPRRTMRDYCKRSDTEQISLGFRPANP
ncbi:hypothetical protein A2U01_0099971, partial [Trifolium medium]|nr:hypothetical protein [Trifolium medium]